MPHVNAAEWRLSVNKDLLEVGKIINTHGLRGEVKVATWTDSPEVFETLEFIYLKKDESMEPLTISGIKYQKNNLIVKFSELKDINEAELLKNKVIYARREDLGELPEGTYYIADLIGMSVKKENNEFVGEIKEVLQTGANDIYVTARPGAKDLLIPVIDDVVLKVDMENREVVVNLMEGLEDL